MKYNVTIKIRYFAYVEVEANTSQQAVDIAQKKVKDDAPHELDCGGFDTECSNIESICAEEQDVITP